jgi:hypothetical protein
MSTLNMLLQIYDAQYKDRKQPKKIKISSSFLNLISTSLTLYEDKNYMGRNEFMGIPFEIDDNILNWKLEY